MFPLPTSSTRALPQRTDSLQTVKPTLSQIEEELRDVRRVHAQGQEEDLRMALSRTITRVEQLTVMLKEAYKLQTDLQTELTLAKSNLQLALANNEMLEDALKREGGGHARDVGWRRWSAREQRERELRGESQSRRQSLESVVSNDGVHAHGHSQQSPIAPSPLPSALVHAPTPVSATTEGRFFKFRFGSTSSPAAASSPRLPSTPNLQSQASHLTSASLPSLVPPRDKDKELDDLTGQLEQERKAHKAAQEAKAALEAELESLSQALFEEANKMVAAERRKLAETEEELKEVQAEKEALKSALRLVETQRIEEGSSRGASPALGDPTRERVPSHGFGPGPRHGHKRSSSSAIAIKSPPMSEPSSPRSSSSRAAPPPPLRLSEDEHGKENEDQAGEEEVAPSLVSRTPPLDDRHTNHTAEAGLGLSDRHALVVSPSPPPAPTSVHSSSPSPPDADPLSSTSLSSDLLSSSSPTPSPGQFAFSSAKPLTVLSYFDGEESPWADVKSSSGAGTPVSATF